MRSRSEDVGVEDDVFGREAGLLVRACRRGCRSPLALEGVGLAELVKRHHHGCRAVFADEAGLLENDSSPPLRLIELQTPLPWTHLRPASRTVHLELSTMIGTRAIFGLRGDQMRKRTIASSESRGPLHVDVEEVGAAADLVKCDLHGAGVVAALDEAAEANRAGDVSCARRPRRTGVGGRSRTARGR